MCKSLDHCCWLLLSLALTVFGIEAQTCREDWLALIEVNHRWLAVYAMEVAVDPPAGADSTSTHGQSQEPVKEDSGK